jgi:endo-1,4-beta-xylanase
MQGTCLPSLSRRGFHCGMAGAARAQVLQRRGTPIDAVGVQSHLWIGENYGGGLRHFIRSLHKLDLQVMVAEMDVNDSRVQGDVAARDRDVGEVYGRCLDLVLSEVVRTVLTWGLTDRCSYMSIAHRRPDGKLARGLPFDRNFQPVEAFHAMLRSFGLVHAARPARG